VQSSGLAALLTGGLLLLARLARLGFLASFLSRTVLAGFLTGVGVQVAAGQLPYLLVVTAVGTRTLSRLAHTVVALPRLIPRLWSCRSRRSRSCWPPDRSRGGYPVR
jgi:MFS superfamily sulfate permease-like transporter